MALSFSEAKRISIVDYLLEAGFEPARIRGNDYWYYSPFRHERTPSLKVNSKLNVWYDHGPGEGGTIIDLGIKLHQCSRLDFLNKLASGNYKGTVSKGRDLAKELPDPKLEVTGIKDFVNAGLLGYLSDRGIKSHFAQEHCKQIEFTIANRSYEAIGFQNRSGGFELRNRWFKGSSSPKDVSFIDNGSEHLCVTEGFIDFLSVLTLNRQMHFQIPVKANFLVLNSLSFLNRSIPILEAHASNLCFFDNDLAGNEARKTLAAKGISFIDGSPMYGRYKDVNDFLCKDPTARSSLVRAKGFRA
jgi:hypothetical protein